MAPALVLVSALAALAAAAARAAQLPSFPAAAADGLGAAALQPAPKWWAQVGRRVYYTPPSALGLSEHVGDYYCAFGSPSALTGELRQQRVGGEGRLHIFHLPRGSVLQVGHLVGSRRSSLSRLRRLRHGMVLSARFPVYEPRASYVNPLSAGGREQLEKTVVGRIAPDSIMAYLSRITSLPDSAFPTRSCLNRSASEAAARFVQAEFESLGLATCRQDFNHSGSLLTNVLAYAPGSGSDAVAVGAHYDSVPASGKAPGAVDNGSGLAVLLEMARAFARSGVVPQRHVYFVAFAGEESGLLGSASFAEKLSSGYGGLPARCRPRAAGPGFLQRRGAQQAIVLDEVGWRSPGLARPTVNLEAYDWASGLLEHLAHASRAHNGDRLQVTHSNNPFGSDHMSFLNRGIPAVLTIMGDDERYPAYHSSQDGLAYVDRDLMLSIARMNTGALLRMAGVQQLRA